MKNNLVKTDGCISGRRLPKEERRQQLLDTALLIIRDEGTDRLTLGHLAACSGVSKPIAYDHFGSRAGLLIELYKIRNAQQADALRVALSDTGKNRLETIDILAANYIRSSAEMCSEWQAVSAALAGSEETDRVYRELLDGYVEFFASVLKPHSKLPPSELLLRCVGLIGAGEAIAATMSRGNASEAMATAAFTSLVISALENPPTYAGS